MGPEAAIPTRDLRPFVPRLVTEWVEHQPEELHASLEGSMVFVDISGFTKLSERLARLGREGIEAVTEIIGGTFEHMLEIAYDMGGSLLKFGGDALLLLFAGDDHEVRACVAAHGMRARLRERGRIETPAGKITLRMTSGVHSGRFDTFLVGESHRELIVAGPGASAVVDTEGSATTGEIRLSEATASALPGHLVRRTSDDGWALARCPRPPATLPLITKRGPTAGMAACLPTAIRAHLDGGGEGSEHRGAAMAFVHFDGIDALVEADPAAAAAALHELVTVVARECDRHEITFLASDIDHDGGKLILASGVPVAHENQEERLLRATRAVIEAATSVPVRIGVFAGPVFSGEVGPFFRRTFTCMGDTVNTAARIMAQAEPGEVLTTAEVLARSATVFATSELEPFHAKGKALPITPVQVGPVVGVRRDADEPVELVGRADELATVVSSADAALAGRPAVVEVIGEAGSGKTRLIHELRSVRPSLSWIEAWCERYESSTPYHALSRLLAQTLPIQGPIDEVRLRQIVESTSPNLVPWIPLIGRALQLQIPDTPEVAALDESYVRHSLHASLATLLAAVITTPTVWLIEDGEWIDEPSAAFLTDLLERLVDTPLLVTVLRRPSAANTVAAPTESLHLTALSDADIRRLAALAAGLPLRPDQLDGLCERADGNPLFLRQLASTISDDDDELPGSLESSVQSRIDALLPADRSVLRRLAVLGRTFDLSAARVVTDDVGVIGGRLSTFLAPTDDGWTFRQAMYREVAYQTLPFRERVQLHVAAARELEERSRGPADTATISAHYEDGREFADALRVGADAARHAEAVHARVDAARAHRRCVDSALRLGLTGVDVAQSALRLGVNLHLAGDSNGALSALSLARQHVPDRHPMVARLARQECSIRDALGQRTSVIRRIRATHRALAGTEDPTAIEDLAALAAKEAEIRMRQGRSSEAVLLVSTAAELAESVGAHQLLAGIESTWADICFAVGDTDGMDHARRALTLAHQHGPLLTVVAAANALGEAALQSGRPREAIEHFAQAADTSERIGATVDAAVVRCNRARPLALTGRLDSSLEEFDAAVPVLQAAGTLWGLWFTAMALWVGCRAGREADPDGVLAEAGEPIGRAAGPAWRAELSLWRAEVLARVGRDAEASELLDELDGDLDDDARGRFYSLRAAIALRGERLDAALAAATAGLAATTGPAMVLERIPALETAIHLARIAGPDAGLPSVAELRQELASIVTRCDIVATAPVPPIHAVVS